MLLAVCELAGRPHMNFTSQHEISRAFVGPRCESCGATESLHVHHINEDWTDHRPENLKTLCINCHLSIHRRKAPPCIVCGAKSRKHKMCQKHYQRWKKHGDPFLVKVRQEGTPNGCRMALDYSDPAMPSRYLPQSPVA